CARDRLGATAPLEYFEFW
nr:immunoglobulin heavy chain junction region [Macaca mulatta]MOV47523.1 immunoglobulin heavy chain junction region [Macaca mulatta]MOV47823.1 immunoglobulin heavy chain junction region [Macaca mulatta]MOV48387.1 immunoglobulin heavy chain junction region [Macaca mulatta]MOV48455.1 immunoglobulin heavy chain junction region [Macaca mulatta]